METKCVCVQSLPPPQPGPAPQASVFGLPVLRSPTQSTEFKVFSYLLGVKDPDPNRTARSCKCSTYYLLFSRELWP